MNLPALKAGPNPKAAKLKLHAGTPGSSADLEQQKRFHFSVALEITGLAHGGGDPLALLEYEDGADQIAALVEQIEPPAALKRATAVWLNAMNSASLELQNRTNDLEDAYLAAVQDIGMLAGLYADLGENAWFLAVMIDDGKSGGGAVSNILATVERDVANTVARCRLSPLQCQADTATAYERTLSLLKTGRYDEADRTFAPVLQRLVIH